MAIWLSSNTHAVPETWRAGSATGMQIADATVDASAAGKISIQTTALIY